MQSGINLFDTQAIAGCGAWSKLEGFAVLPIVSLSLALSTFAGQNLGAGNFERVRRGTKLGIIAGAAMSVAVGAILYIFAPQLIGLFNSDPDVIAFGVWKAAWTAPFFVPVGVSNCIGGSLRGMGRTVESMFVYLGCWCLIRVLLINVGLDIVRDIRIVFAAYPITWLLSTVFSPGATDAASSASLNGDICSPGVCPRYTARYFAGQSHALPGLSGLPCRHFRLLFQPS